jgi:2-hydroxychromene-2-carboxylate isomerase
MQRFIRNHGITQFTWNPFFPVNTLLIMRAAVAAQLEGVFDRYVDAAFKAMWADQKNMSDADVVAGALQEAGLDGARLIARTQEPEVKERLLKNTEASVARGTFGSPTFFVGDEIFFGKDKLRDVEAEIARGKR